MSLYLFLSGGVGGGEVGGKCGAFRVRLPFRLFLISFLSHNLLPPSFALNRDILSNQRSNDDISSPTSGGGLTLQQQTQLLAILAGAAFQGGKQEETVEAEARPA